jgi:hypothetical protein
MTWLRPQVVEAVLLGRCVSDGAYGVGIVTPKRLVIAAEIAAASPPMPRQAGRQSLTGGSARPASPLGD